LVFSSHFFLFYFLPFTLLAYYLMPRRGKHLLLTLLSYAFYGWSNPYFVLLMLFSTVVDYCCGLVIARPFGQHRNAPVPLLEAGGPRSRSQKTALATSILTNLGLLGFFKYFHFGIESYNELVTTLGLEAMRWDLFLRITLPLGISFYTFQSMSYSIDVYRGQARAIRDFTDFACYVSMFPQLVAGPIIRFHEVAHQFLTRTHSVEKFARGVAFFCLGMAKKVLLANPCGKIADTMFEAGSVHVLDAWYGITGYAFQIYFDFSGYSDMAIGLGLMLGFVFPKNFDRPYLSASITEFWQRWHLSLSHWLRDYLYIPLGGNRMGSARTYANLATVMLLGGLWHGAAWNFVVWGGIHGGMLAFERAQGKQSLYHRLPHVLRIAITFFVVLIAWVFFRAATLDDALGYLGNLFAVGELQPGADLLRGLVNSPYALLCFGLSAWVAFGCRDTWDFTRRLTSAKAAICLGWFVLAVVALTTQEYNPFIYFIF
jgi:alginate O-acetyltransferase complex protein AlgI